MRILRNMLIGTGLLFLSSCGVQPQTNDTADVNKGDIIIENIMTRGSVRSFTSEPVSRDTLQLIMRAGMQAPSGLNKQDWEIRMIDNQDKLNAFSDILKKANPNAPDRYPGKNSFGNAAAVAFVACETEGTFAQVDAALLGENMLLAAHGLGLGAVIQAGPLAITSDNADAQAFIKDLGFSAGYKPLFIILIGHPDEAVVAKERDHSKAKFVD